MVCSKSVLSVFSLSGGAILGGIYNNKSDLLISGFLDTSHNNVLKICLHGALVALAHLAPDLILFNPPPFLNLPSQKNIRKCENRKMPGDL